MSVNNDAPISNQSMKQGILSVFNANTIGMLFSVIIGFLQPKFLPVSTYAALKTFSLYQIFLGTFHLGYEDGMVLKYGGKNIEDIDKHELSSSISTLRLCQLCVSAVVFLFAVLKTNMVLGAFALFILPYNLTMLFVQLEQAVGNFKQYGKVTNLINVLLLASNLVLILLFREHRVLPYLVMYPVIYTLLWIRQEITYCRSFRIPFRGFSFSKALLFSYVGAGFFLMVGNFSSIIFVSLDRWFVKFLLPEVDFARYSFAVTMENMLLVAVTPFSVTLYNYFCRERDTESARNVTGFMLIYATAVIAAAFPVRMIIEWFLPDYAASGGIITVLFCAQAFFIIIRSVYINLYKARKMQKVYFIKLVCALISGVVFNALFYYFLRNAEAMAIGTLCSALLWFLLCQRDFEGAGLRLRQWGYLAVVLCGFVLTGRYLHPLSGMIAYICLIAAAGALLVRSDLTAALRRLKALVSSGGRI